MKTFAKTSILIIAIMAFVGGIAHAATLNGVVPQTITTGDTMGRGWYQDINNRLPPTGGTPWQQLAKDANGKLVWRTPQPLCSGTVVTPVSAETIATVAANQTMPASWFQTANNRMPPPPNGATTGWVLTINSSGNMAWQAPQSCASSVLTCGSSHGSTVASAPTASLCSDGSLPTASLVGSQYVWSCSPSVSCSAYKSSCAMPVPACSTLGCTLTTTPSTIYNQAWVKGASSCGFSCNLNYTGSICETHLDVPTIDFHRTCDGVDCTVLNPGVMHGANWTISGATTASYTCTSGPVSDVTHLNVTISMPDVVSNNFASYDDMLSVFGWRAGHYACLATAVWPGGTTTKDISFEIAAASTSCPNASTWLDFSGSYPSQSCSEVWAGNGCSDSGNDSCWDAFQSYKKSYDPATHTLVCGRTSGASAGTFADFGASNATTGTCWDFWTSSSACVGDGTDAGGKAYVTYRKSCTQNTANTYTYVCGRAWTTPTCSAQPAVVPYCQADPTFAHVTLLQKNPIIENEAWSYADLGTLIPGTTKCTYNCLDGYSGENCATAPTAVCTGSIPANAVENNVMPDNTEYEYRDGGCYDLSPDRYFPNYKEANYCEITGGHTWTTTVSEPCSFQCESGFEWNGTSCIVPSATSPSCATTPTFANVGTTTTGTPTSVGQAWTYNTTPGNCTYVCANGYSGTNCATAPVVTPDPVANTVICNSISDCMSKAGVSRGLDGRSGGYLSYMCSTEVITIGEWDTTVIPQEDLRPQTVVFKTYPILAATKICTDRGMGYVSHTVNSHNVYCGGTYGLSWSDGTTFSTHENIVSCFASYFDANGICQIGVSSVEEIDSVTCSGTPPATTGGSTGGWCFVAGTQINMADGSTKSIEDVKIGDRVQTYDDMMGGMLSSPIIDTLHHETKLQQLYTFSYGEQTVTSNDIHPFFLPKEAKYVPASEIYDRWSKGEEITFLDADNAMVKVSNIVHTVKDVPVYNLHIASKYGIGNWNHNFFANGVLVHNVWAANSYK